MANILYWSVHEALEYDDIILFKSLGHCVYPLGAYFPLATATNPFRPNVAADIHMSGASEIFTSSGCKFAFRSVAETELSQEFFDAFDIIIVMHDVHFIGKNWDKIRNKKVVWRTIGQAIRSYDQLMVPYRAEGLSIVRWSPRELLTDYYAGHDAIIRGYKDEGLYKGWSGYLSDEFITFVSAYELRYSEEQQFFQHATHDRICLVGGGSNASMRGSIGLVSHEEQIDLLRHSFCYLYMHASEVPYTLNFIEAWMTGMPVILLDRCAEGITLDRTFNEINDFIVHGKNGYKVRSPIEANMLMKHLQDNRHLAAEIGRRGRISAIQLFGLNRAKREWNSFLQTLLV